ncbi:MAG: MGMT family protein [Anaerolineae bacterium]|nr:MGMT family protein [Anaerolineae bacterium]
METIENSKSKIQNQFEQVYALVREIPRGKVASYGQIARWLGWPRGARTVGWALRALHTDDVPWHRVVNSQGRVSLRNDDGLQQALLEAEGIVFDTVGRIDLKTYGWTGPLIPWGEDIAQVKTEV